MEDKKGLTLSIGEVLDRLCIELRKGYYFGENGTKIDECLESLRDFWKRKPKITPEQMTAYSKYILELANRNADIWANEWGIRAGKDLPLEELGRRARLTRKLNDDRCKSKQEIDILFEMKPEKRGYGYGEYGTIPEPQDPYKLDFKAVEEDE